MSREALAPLQARDPRMETEVFAMAACHSPFRGAASRAPLQPAKDDCQFRCIDHADGLI